VATNGNAKVDSTLIFTNEKTDRPKPIKNHARNQNCAAVHLNGNVGAPLDVDFDKFKPFSKV
jgi:hypothetical protein